VFRIFIMPQHIESEAPPRTTKSSASMSLLGSTSCTRTRNMSVWFMRQRANAARYEVFQVLVLAPRHPENAHGISSNRAAERGRLSEAVNYIDSAKPVFKSCLFENPRPTCG